MWDATKKVVARMTFSFTPDNAPNHFVSDFSDGLKLQNLTSVFIYQKNMSVQETAVGCYEMFASPRNKANKVNNADGNKLWKGCLFSSNFRTRQLHNFEMLYFMYPFIENKRCLRGSKNPYKMSLKRYLMNWSTPFSVTFLIWWPTFPWSGKLENLEADCFQNECKSLLSPSGWIYHLLPQQLSVMDLISELCEIQGITFSVFEPMKLVSKEKILKIHDFLALSNARFK